MMEFRWQPTNAAEPLQQAQPMAQQRGLDWHPERFSHDLVTHAVDMEVPAPNSDATAFSSFAPCLAKTMPYL
ncbi:hypothetical protein [Melaminivora suipulveris]|uniref:hypothetical protein n=1 Tax=Melaminivora suipulveris TaxID=2109913 RepID=UPI00131A5631|nr:hypothetical protein [Melaminivora suipulveris]